MYQVGRLRSNNKDNQLTQIDGSSALVSYDRAGNATKTPPGTGGDWTKYHQPVWDAWNRIVEVKDESGASVQKNAYDGLTRRITKEAASVVTHTYWSDRWKPLEERTGSATTAARSYVWGERPGHRDELILRDRDTDGNGSLDERLYATMDYFNGTAVMNTSGAVQERYAYSAFGVRRIMAADFSPRSTSSYAWDFGFQGQFRDAETGWSNYGYRFYVPLLGRWINRDPIGEKVGANLYSYLNNEPISRHDLLGLFDPTTCAVAVEVAAGTTAGAVIGAAAATFAASFAVGYGIGQISGLQDCIENIENRKQWYCGAQCNVQMIDPNACCPPRTYGSGSAKTQHDACTEAKRAATQSAPEGCYARHCRCFECFRT